MATLEARGFVKKLELKESAKGPYAKFDLAVKQKRKGKDGQQVGGEKGETLYFRCIDFDPKNVPADGDYVGVTGYVTLSTWTGAEGKAGLNVDVSVKSYEKFEQRPRDNAGPGAGKADAAPPSDPFDLKKP